MRLASFQFWHGRNENGKTQWTQWTRKFRTPSLWTFTEAQSCLPKSSKEVDSQNDPVSQTSNWQRSILRCSRHVDGYVSVGHTASLEAFHTMKLLLERRGW